MLKFSNERLLDIVRLLEIKIKRISKYDSFRADEQIKGFEDEIKEVEGNLSRLLDMQFVT